MLVSKKVVLVICFSNRVLIQFDYRALSYDQYKDRLCKLLRIVYVPIEINGKVLSKTQQVGS